MTKGKATVEVWRTGNAHTLLINNLRVHGPKLNRASVCQLNKDIPIAEIDRALRTRLDVPAQEGDTFSRNPNTTP